MKVGRRKASTGCWWSSEQSTGVWASASHTDENVDSWVAVAESERQTSEPPNSRGNFTWGGGIHRSSVSRIIHKNLRLKCCKKRRAQQLTEAHSMHALFSACSLRDDNVIKSKPTWKLQHANSILESFQYFYQISSKSIHIFSSYRAYRFKVWLFFETQCILHHLGSSLVCK